MRRCSDRSRRNEPRRRRGERRQARTGHSQSRHPETACPSRHRCRAPPGATARPGRSDHRRLRGRNRASWPRTRTGRRPPPPPRDETRHVRSENREACSRFRQDSAILRLDPVDDAPQRVPRRRFPGGDRQSPAERVIPDESIQGRRQRRRIMGRYEEGLALIFDEIRGSRRAPTRRRAVPARAPRAPHSTSRRRVTGERRRRRLACTRVPTPPTPAR